MTINETFIIGDISEISGNTKTITSNDNSLDIILSGNNYDLSVIKTNLVISGGTIPVTNGGVFDYVENTINNINDFYTTGGTFNNKNIIFDRNDLLSAYTINLSSLYDDIPNLGNNVWKKSNLTGNTNNKTEDTYREGSVNLVGNSIYFRTGQNVNDINSAINGTSFGHIHGSIGSVIPFIQLSSNDGNGLSGTNNIIGRLTGAAFNRPQMNFSVIKSTSYDSWNDANRVLFRWQDGYLNPLPKFEIGTDYIKFNNYTSSRNDSGNTVNNLLFTDNTGVLKSRPINVILSGKSDLISPAFSGTPTAPTAASGSNTTQIATTAFVTQSVNNLNITGFTYDSTFNKFTISSNNTQLTTSLTNISGLTTTGNISPVNDNIVNLGSNTSRFREINTVSGKSSVWVSTNSIITNELNLGLDLNSEQRTINANNSIIVNDILDGGIY